MCFAECGFFSIFSAVTPEPQPEILTKGIDLVIKGNVARFNLMPYQLEESCKSGAAQANNWRMKGVNFKSESISGVACKKRSDRSLNILLPSSLLRRYASVR